jgi:hypothetical protein
MPGLQMQSESPIELHPQLLYRVDGASARFATWRLNEGHEALALFTTAETAMTYRESQGNSGDWTVYQPMREKLVEILEACRGAGILYAALDPIGGNAKTLFDIPQVLAAAAGA